MCMASTATTTDLLAQPASRRNCAGSAAIHEYAILTMDRHGLRPRDDEAVRRARDDRKAVINDARAIDAPV